MKRRCKTVLRLALPLLVVSLFCFSFLSRAFADSQNFNSSGDSYVQSGSPNANNGSKVVMDLNDTRDGVVKFDISAIPSGATVTSATLTLVATAVGSATAVKNYGAHRILADWSESTVTWNTPGSTAGTHFATSATQTIAVSAKGSYGWDVTGDVAGFVNGSATNHGWRIIWSSNTSGTNKQVDFGTKENGTPSNRPVLNVIYTTPTPTPIPSETVSPTSTPTGTPTSAPTATPLIAGQKRAHTTVIFSGRAFPDAKIFIVDKAIERNVHFETTINRDIVADENGIFQVSFVGVPKASHSFGLLIKDKENRATQTKFFTIDTVANELVVKDVIIPPTVGLSQRTISRGQAAVVVGNASPNNKVVLEIDDTIKKEANAEKDGSYKITVDSDALEYGAHHVRVKQVNPGQEQESDYSLMSTFVVSRLTMPKTDLSGDGVVDIKDWSMFLSKWGSKDERNKKIIDLNDDGKVDISDFSVFIRSVKK